MPIEVRDLRALEGPNLYYGQAAVKLELWADRDIRTELADAIKIWAQRTGVVIGYLQQDARPADGGFVLTTTFTTPFPNVGERIVEGAVADLQAAERDDEDYSHDDVVFEVMRLRKREEPPLPLLQIYAEARARDLPFLPREDGTVIVGSGARGFVFDPSGLSLGLQIDIPWEEVGRIPVLAVTGTNGKTTTVRLCAHILRRSGKRVGQTDTDGITIAGEIVEEGDWAGFGGARRVLTDQQVDIAVLETSRGGILRRGLGFDLCDVSVITNISPDHLGELGVDTLDEMARVKGVVALVTRAEGRAVLNADDEHVAALEEFIGAPIMWFSRRPDNPRVQRHVELGGDAAWRDGTAANVVWQGRRSEFRLTDLPIVVGGAAEHNIDNVLAATAACVALGVEVEAIQAGLREFGARENDNEGRLNIFRRDDVTATLDYAHNEAGVAALMNFGRRLQASRDGRLIVLLGGPGDRLDAQILAQGKTAGASADLLLLHEEERYLRGREPGETAALYRKGALDGGLAPQQIHEFASEIEALREAFRLARAGDVILAAAHAQRDEMLAALRAWKAGAEGE